MTMITLQQAIRELSREKGASLNAYDRYRRSAKEWGSVSIGDSRILVRKERGTWVLDESDFKTAIESHRTRIDKIARVTRDYESGILHGADGDSVTTDWGGYRHRGDFYISWSHYARAQDRSEGIWHCRTCNKPASTERGKPECHTCSDWNGCGRDCTLSKVFCTDCGTSLSM